ncbi:unnamed protein product [Pleuronectes platessa]|uniref:Uncharacterized protein n=1 Tax=Pleuronectes platessa TaxID=8262 RepID=A0A9N7VMR1_PLEPL|nr:unnamed protein product [Pleuronectes platessa]
MVAIFHQHLSRVNTDITEGNTQARLSALLHPQSSVLCFAGAVLAKQQQAGQTLRQSSNTLPFLIPATCRHPGEPLLFAVTSAVCRIHLMKHADFLAPLCAPARPLGRPWSVRRKEGGYKRTLKRETAAQESRRRSAPLGLFTTSSLLMWNR